MARDEQVTVTCDARGCRKTLGGNHDHVYLSVTHLIADKDAPEGQRLAPVVAGLTLDFCSYEHAADYLRAYGSEADEIRAGIIEAAQPPVEEADAPAEAEAEAESG